MARWLQSAGLQHLASPIHGYGPHSAEEKPRLLKFTRSLNYNDPDDRFYSPQFRGDFGAGLFDLKSMDDTELLSDHVISEPFMPSPSTPVVNNTRDNHLAKIKVVVRKRPLNKKEISRKEDDIVTVDDDVFISVHEPKLKVDLTAYVEKHEFCFDAVLDEHVSNDEVYRNTVEPIIPTIFERAKATCFAFGQTGSGKTYTMQPLPLRAAGDLVRLLHQPVYRDQRFKLWLSFFEIYGGKLFDLLNDRKKLCMREDGRQQVCIVGLSEFEVSDLRVVKEYIERGSAIRSTGSTGANEESSRSHAILQLVVKKHNYEVKESNKRKNDGNESKGKVVGKISFIDLAGSERGADTTDNDRQTRIEGAEINKSLLALKECIRALDNDQTHIPFRGSKLTEVLRDSFVGNSRTVMISCISPNAGSCEHTLNTLRYADRVKSLSKSGNPRKDQTSSLPPSVVKEFSSAPTFSLYEQNQESKISPYNFSTDDEKQPSIFSSNFTPKAREETVKSALTSQKVSPPRQNAYIGEKLEKPEYYLDISSSNSLKQQKVNTNSTSNGSKQYENESPRDESINETFEEEEALIAAHRQEIDDTMEIVREEMKLLGEVDQPGSHIDNYVSQLSFVLSRKAATVVSLQARLAKFQHLLKE